MEKLLRKPEPTLDLRTFDPKNSSLEPGKSLKCRIPCQAIRSFLRDARTPWEENTRPWKKKISEDHQLSKTPFATDWIKGSLTKCRETNLDTGIICVSTPNSSQNSQVLVPHVLFWDGNLHLCLWRKLSSFSQMCPFSPSTFSTSLNKHCSIYNSFLWGQGLEPTKAV